jgi:chromosome segregation ATPase
MRRYDALIRSDEGCVRSHVVHARGPRQAAAAALGAVGTTKIAIVSASGDGERVQVHTFAVDKKGGVSKRAAKISFASSLQTAASLFSRSGSRKCDEEEEDEDEGTSAPDPDRDREPTRLRPRFSTRHLRESNSQRSFEGPGLGVAGADVLRMMLERRARLLEQNVAALRAQLAACQQQKGAECPSIPQPATSNGEEARVRSALEAAERALVLLRQQMADAEKTYQIQSANSAKEARQQREREMQYERDLAAARNQRASELTDVQNQLRIESEKRSQIEVQYNQLQKAQQESVTALLKANETIRQSLLNDQAAKDRALVAAANEQRASQELAIAVKRQAQASESESKEVAFRLQQAKEEAERKLRACQEKKGKAYSEVDRCGRARQLCIKERDEVIQQMNSDTRRSVQLRTELETRASADSRRIIELEQDLNEQTKKLNEMNQQVKLCQDTRRVESKEIDRLMFENDHLTSLMAGRDAAAQERLKDAQERLRDAEERTNELLQSQSKEREELENELNAKLLACETERKAAADELDLLRTDYERCGEGLKKADDEVNRLKADLESTTEQLSEAQDQIGTGEQEIKRLQDEKAAWVQKCGERLRVQGETCTARLQKSNIEVQKVTRELNGRTTELAACRERIRLLETASAPRSGMENELAEAKVLIAALTQAASLREQKCGKLEKVNSQLEATSAKAVEDNQKLTEEYAKLDAINTQQAAASAKELATASAKAVEEVRKLSELFGNSKAEMESALIAQRARLEDANAQLAIASAKAEADNQKSKYSHDALSKELSTCRNQVQGWGVREATCVRVEKDNERLLAALVQLVEENRKLSTQVEKAGEDKVELKQLKLREAEFLTKESQLSAEVQELKNQLEGQAATAAEAIKVLQHDKDLFQQQLAANKNVAGQLANAKFDLQTANKCLARATKPSKPVNEVDEEDCILYQSKLGGRGRRG